VDWFGKGEPRSLDGDLIRMVEAAALRAADVVHANSRANAEFWREKTGREILVIPPAYGGGTKTDLTTEDTEFTETVVGPCLDKPSGAVFSNPFTSELARVSENTSPTRSASDPASSLATSYSRPVTAPQALKGLVVGRLQNWKGAEVLCRALRLVPEIGIEWVGGDTDWGSSGRKASEYLAANYPDVFGKQLRWIGRLDRSEVAKKMHAAGFLVVPSLWDVFNLTVAEGMEAGLPVVCSRAAGAEMVIEHGKSGLLFDPAKPEELAACLNRIVEMSAVDRNEMGHKAQEVVKTLLSEERILNLLEGSYGDAIKRGVTTSKEAWLASLLSAGSECIASHPDRIWHRDVPKAALNAKKIVKKMIGRK
jgi:glycosyltransferase involved in cell wall biosynthesis